MARCRLGGWPDLRRRSIYQGAITTPKTAHSIRAVDVPASLLACLAIYRAYCPPLAGGFIFRTETGAPVDPDNWTKRVFAGILARAEGVRAISLHGLRHTYASLLINQGEHIKYVSKQLGHASIQITADLYSHLFTETSTVAMARLDARFGAAPKNKVVAMSARRPR
jgi:integrase